MSDILLSARGLTKHFPLRSGKTVHAVEDVSLDIFAGETLSLVGESGCGKSTLGRCITGLIKPTSGSVFLGNDEISAMSERELRPFRRKMQFIFQDPYASLDPRMTVFDIIAEPLRTHGVCADKNELRERILEIAGAVGIPPEHLSRYPHQFSGGQRQRVGIARAIALGPELIVCDEPVSALDVSVQNQILNLLKRLQKERGLTYLFISHDLSVVRFLSDRVCVMFLGCLCELGDTETVYADPVHPYTRFLIGSIPSIDPTQRSREKKLLSGEIPSPIAPPSGCRFHTRCPYATEKCRAEKPELRKVRGRLAACHYAGEI